MFDQKQFSYLDETLEQQCLFAFLGINGGMVSVATDALERIHKVCAELLESRNNTQLYEPARIAVHIAEIGIYALGKGEEQVFHSPPKNIRTSVRGLLILTLS